MDESTDGVTLRSGFVLTIVDQCRGMERICAPLFEMVAHLDPTDPEAQVPMALYNDVSAWIEEHLGAASVRAAGAAIGKAAFARMRRTREIADGASPVEALTALARTVLVTIHDPKKRGWEVLDAVEGRVRMRRTQTFHCVMQEGVLLAVAEGTGVLMPRVDHVKCTRNGAPHCEYDVRWLVKRASRSMTPVTRPRGSE